MPCSICVFLENADFQKRAEHLLESLYTAGGQAAVHVKELSEGMTRQREALRGITSDIGVISRTQQEVRPLVLAN